MRLAAALALALGLALPGAAPAAAAGPPSGPSCDYAGVYVPDVGAWTFVLYGGPLTAGGEVSMTCALHVDNADHAGPAAHTETSAYLPGATALEPRVARVVASVDAEFAVCTSAVVAGTSWYLTEGAWTTDASGPCGSLSAVPPPAGEVIDRLATILDCTRWPHSVFGLLTCEPLFALTGAADAELCPLLAAHRPGVPGVRIEDDGDVYVADWFVWDCPPYT